MISELWIGKDFEGSDYSAIKELSRHFSGGTEENHKNTAVSIADLPTDILIEYKSRTSLLHQ
jgi:hypothetical protein